MNRHITIIFLLLLSIPLAGQEIVIGLQSNNALKTAKPVARVAVIDTLDLPFLDDFSSHSITPDERLWSDKNVLINDTYSNAQPSKGVATFDIIDGNGDLYEDASSYSFQADILTSKPIDLAYQPNDNVKLSFFYEAGGLGDKPEAGDYLTLQFYVPDDDIWELAWESEGSDFDGFKPIIISIDDPRFLKKGFRFRFMNYGSLGNLSEPSMVGNCDQWNIDYVKLDKNRADNDTVVADVAFRFPHRSLLKEYEAMPWKQFKEVYLQEMNGTLSICYRNNDIITRNVTRNFQITDLYTNKVVKTFSGGASNINPLTNVDYEIGHFYTFASSRTDSALFEVKSWLLTDDFDHKENDTIVYYQHFTNYYAYDDGSAEGGYGINGLGSSNAMLAVRFRAYVPDTLYSVNIRFNDSFQNRNNTLFTLTVWDDNDGQPGNIIAEVEDCEVKQATSINGFTNYTLSEPLTVDGTFYVGWKQQNETFLNAGFDVNTPHNGRQLFWINGEWTESQVNGIVMVRPITEEAVITSISNVNNDRKEFKKFDTIDFYPNPAKDYIRIDTDRFNVESDIISIFDITGRALSRKTLSEVIDISYLKTGVYIILISRDNTIMGRERLIKTE